MLGPGRARRYTCHHDVFTDPVLARIAEEAQRLTGGKCAIRVLGSAPSALAIEVPGDSIIRGRWLHKRLTAFCARGGFAKRYLVVSGTQARFTPKPPPVPEGWPLHPDGA